MHKINLYGFEVKGFRRAMAYVIPFLFVILDTLNFFIYKEVGLTNNTSVSYWFKGIVLVLMLVSLLASKNRELLHIVLILSFIIIPILWLPSFVNFDRHGVLYAFYSIKEISKFMLPFILYYFLKNEEVGVVFVRRFLNSVFISFALVSIAAFIFEIDYFRTYSIRFGYKPLIASQNESSFFLMCAFFFMFHELRKYGVSVMNIAKLSLVMFAALLLGTKAVYVVLFLLLSILMVCGFRLLIIRILAVIFLCVFFIGFFTYTDLLSYFLDAYEKRGFLDTVSSMRFSIFLDNFSYFLDNWQWYNYMFGGFKRSFPIFEMDIFDIFAISGFLGLSLYFIIFKRFVDDIRASQFSVILIVVFLLIGIVAGRTLNSGVNALYLAMTLIYFRQSDVKRISGLRGFPKESVIF